MMLENSLEETLYPETVAGGFTRVDGTVAFYTRINALVESSMIVLDFGAGRAAAADLDPSAFRRNLRILRGKVRKVIGADIDPIVTQNPTIDEAIVLTPNTALPLSDESIDLIISDYTFEHIDDPKFIADEFYRVLRPGGWICARTPNKLGYIGIGARALPNRRHRAILKHLQPNRKEIDVFPTTYHLNTWRDIRKFFGSNRFSHHTYTWNPEPAYFGRSKIAWHIMNFLFRFLPQKFGSVFFIFLKKR